jgi:hypothetical protein
LNSPAATTPEASTVNGRRSFLARIPFHPLLIALAPALMLISGNLGQVHLGSTWRSLLVSFAATVMCLLFFQFIFRERHRAALSTSFLLLLALSYGHLYRALRDIPVWGIKLSRHRYLIPVIALSVILFFWRLARVRRLSPKFSEVLNAVAVVMILVPLLQIIAYEYRVYASSSEQTEQTPPALTSLLEGEYVYQGAGDPPDIYYIVLDGYGREDVLQEYFHLDNREFLQNLSRRGFYIADCSQSNYVLTALSLTSTLNTHHLENFGIDLADSDLYDVGRFAKDNVLRRILEDMGYKIVAFETGYFVTEWADAHLYLSYEDTVKGAFSGLNAFEAMYLDSTIAKVPLDFRNLLPQSWSPFLDYAYTVHRERTLYMLEQLEKLPSMNLGGPKFVMAHILAPHPPFVFGPNGEVISQRETFTLKEDILYTDREDYISGYRDQVKFVNKRVLALVDALLSSGSPIIILQGDHGPGRSMTSEFGRTSILNAYHLPGGARHALYPNITPVNSFRIVLNEVFNAQYPLAEDVSRFSPYSKPLSFTIVEEENPACLQGSTQ